MTAEQHDKIEAAFKCLETESVHRTRTGNQSRAKDLLIIVYEARRALSQLESESPASLAPPPKRPCTGAGGEREGKNMANAMNEDLNTGDWIIMKDGRPAEVLAANLSGKFANKNGTTLSVMPDGPPMQMDAVLDIDAPATLKHWEERGKRS